VKKIISILLLNLLWVSCNEEPGERQYTEGTFPAIPMNLADINSEYDDYNSTPAMVGTAFPLCFSSNRNSQGADFDIVFKLLEIWFNLIDGSLTIGEFKNTNWFLYENYTLTNALKKINTSGNEYGPYLVGMGTVEGISTTTISGNYQGYVFMYSTNITGNHDINFLHNLDSEEFSQPEPVSFLNSAYDDAYPTFNRDNSGLFFCSNREGDFDIFKTDTDNKLELIDILGYNSPKTILKDSILSSDFDDKCPFISRNMLVFTSNRSGGFGGYDLYYSYFENGNWTEPVNFGSTINTRFDEYRPILKPMRDFTNDLMIFSSNRPGGKGGFDLYYVGVKKLDEEYNVNGKWY
jgi:hypothetical protein